MLNSNGGTLFLIISTTILANRSLTEFDPISLLQHVRSPITSKINKPENHFEIILVQAGHRGAWAAPDTTRQRQNEAGTRVKTSQQHHASTVINETM